VTLAEFDALTMRELPVGPLDPCRCRQRNATAEPLTQQPGASDVIRVHVGLQGPDELESKLFDQRGVAPGLLEYCIDQNRLPRILIGEQVGVGGRLWVEELPENHRLPP
jgi:hypothetical protein